MITNINKADQLRDKLDIAIKQSIEKYFDEHPNTKNFVRNRKLGLETMIRLLLTMEGGDIQSELYKADIKVSDVAFSKQRKKLSYTIFENILQNFNALCDDDKKYRGYRVYAVDGTAVNMPRNPNSKSFVSYEANPVVYNQLHLTPLSDVLNKTYHSAIIQPQPEMDEVGALTFMAEWYIFNEPVLIVADRGFESYNTIAHLTENTNTKFLIRVKNKVMAMKEIAKLPMQPLDVDLSFTITTRQTNEVKEKGYTLIQMPKKPNAVNRKRRWDFGDMYQMNFRVVRIELPDGKLETLVTNLPHDFTPDDLSQLYHSRWGIETAFKELKYSLGLVNLHGKSDEFVMQEIYAHLIMANFTNRIINEIIIPDDENKIYEYQVNTKMAIMLCREFFRDKTITGKKVMKNIAKYTEPVREGRADERHLKAKGFVGFTYRVKT